MNAMREKKTATLATKNQNFNIPVPKEPLSVTEQITITYAFNLQKG
jgi:hypothetical protein